jgi:hypothetical protein
MRSVRRDSVYLQRTDRRLEDTTAIEVVFGVNDDRVSLPEPEPGILSEMLRFSQRAGISGDVARIGRRGLTRRAYRCTRSCVCDQDALTETRFSSGSARAERGGLEVPPMRRSRCRRRSASTRQAGCRVSIRLTRSTGPRSIWHLSRTRPLRVLRPLGSGAIDKALWAAPTYAASQPVGCRGSRERCCARTERLPLGTDTSPLATRDGKERAAPVC